MAPSLVVRVSANLDEMRKNLKEGTAQIETTKAQLERLSKSFNGEKLVQSAHNVTAAINKVGVATLNTSEGARSLNLLDKAMDKLLRTGQQVPPEMMKTAAELRRMGRATEEADKAVNRISGTYRQFDGILQMMGINIGPYVRGLEDITNAVGGVKAAAGGATGAATGMSGALSMLGPAAAVAATAIGAWKVGTWIGEQTGFTDAISRSTAAMMGYGDVAKVTALAVAEAGRGAELYAINLKRQAEASTVTTRATTETVAAIEQTVRAQQEALAASFKFVDAARAQAQGLKDSERAALDAAQAQSVLGASTATTTTGIQAQTTALDERDKSLKRIEDDEAARKKKNADFMNGGSAKEEHAKEQKELADRLRKGVSFDLAPLTKSQLMEMGTKPGGRFDEKNLREKLAYLEGREGTIRPTNNEEFFALQRENVLLAQLRMYFQGYGRPETLDSFAGGVTNFRGGVAKVHKDELLVNMPKGTDVIPAGRSVSGGSVVNNFHINLSGMVGNSHELGRIVAEALNTHLTVSGFRYPEGF